jgi:hypothetical protein
MNKDKAEEIRHILKMLESQAWVDDKVVENEINARIWSLSLFEREGLIIISFNGGNIHYRFKHWPTYARTMLHYSFQHPEYLSSLDAIKVLENGDWSFSCNQNRKETEYGTEGYVCAYGTACVSPRLPTEEAARLYAVLLTYLYDGGG